MSCKCDLIGVFRMAPMLINAYIGEPVTAEDILSVPMDVCRLGEDTYWIENFCYFQYGELSEASRPHKKYIKMLKDANLLDRVSNRVSDRLSDSLKDKDKEQDKDKEEDKDKEQEEIKEGLNSEVDIKGTKKIDSEMYHHYFKLFQDIKPYNQARNHSEVISLFREAAQDVPEVQILEAAANYKQHCYHAEQPVDFRKSVKTFLSEKQYKIDWLMQHKINKRGDSPKELWDLWLARNLKHPTFEWST